MHDLLHQQFVWDCMQPIAGVCCWVHFSFHMTYLQGDTEERLEVVVSLPLFFYQIEDHWNVIGAQHMYTPKYKKFGHRQG